MLPGVEHTIRKYEHNRVLIKGAEIGSEKSLARDTQEVVVFVGSPGSGKSFI